MSLVFILGYSDKYQCAESGCCYDTNVIPSCYHSTVPPPNPQCQLNVTRIPCGTLLYSTIILIPTHIQKNANYIAAG